jgi:hypothetical protein
MQIAAVRKKANTPNSQRDDQFIRRLTDGSPAFLDYPNISRTFAGPIRLILLEDEPGMMRQ